MHAKHALDKSGNDQLVVIWSPSGDTDVIVMAIVHHLTERLIIDNSIDESRRMMVCDQNWKRAMFSTDRFPLIYWMWLYILIFPQRKNYFLEETLCKAKFLTALSILENQVTLDDETFSTLEEYTCCLYGSNSRNINKLRFQKFTQKYKHEGNYFDLALLPPCRNPKSKLNCLLDETCKYYNSSRATPSIQWLGCN